MSEEKKIIIDEDWKSQVEAEKEAAKQASPEEVSTEAAPEAVASVSGDTGGADDDPQMPPASLEMLLTTLATEALLAMGQMPHPVTGETQVRRNQAKYLIDTIEVLKEKTAGNVSEPESQAIEAMLHQLRMAFVATN